MNDFIFNFINCLNTYIETYYLYSICLYFIALIIFFSLALPGGLIILLASGFLFGTFQGFIINIVSISFGSLIFIYFSETLFKNFFNKLYLKYSEKLKLYIKDSSYEYLILLRLIIGPPLFIQNICISFLNINKKKILITSLIGFSPSILFFSYVGNYISNIIELMEFSLSQIISYEFILILFVIIIFIIFKIINKKSPPK